MPNLLTVLRIIFASLIALILIFFDSKIAYFISFILFSLAGITDYFDGWLARKKGQISDLGSCLLYTSPSPRDRQKSRMPSSA